jgi:hypothetical protein
MKVAFVVLLLCCVSIEARELAVVELSGPPYERGLKHGRALKAQIGKSIAIWKKALQDQTRHDPEGLIAEFLRDRDFMAATRHWTPEVIDEVHGIADGASQPFDTMWAMQLIDEMWVFIDEQSSVAHCSSAGVPGRASNPAYVAQNLDIDWFYDGFQTVLHVKEEQGLPEQLIFTTAGVVALNGMNNRSIAVAVNTLSELRASRDGLPVAFVIRGILSKQNAGEALSFVKSVPHASGQNYIVGAGDRVYDFEASAGKVVQYAPNGEQGTVYHTNEALVNDDRNALPVNRTPTNSRIRLDALRKRLRNDNSGADEITSALRSRDSEEHPVCRRMVQGKVFTFGSTIMTLSKHPLLQVSMGPPDTNPYRRFEFSILH